MINNDYLRGYFDAHGYAYFCPTRKGTRPSPKVYCKDKDNDQIERVVRALREFGYHPIFYRCNPHTNYSRVQYTVLYLARYGECARFAREVGSERPELQDRLQQMVRFEEERAG